LKLEICDLFVFWVLLFVIFYMIWTKEIESSAFTLLKLALTEDHADNDITSIVSFSQNQASKVQVVARENCVLAGLSIINLVYKLIDDDVSINTYFSDGESVKNGEIIAEISGKTAAILSGERTVLNFIQRLGGTATITKKYVDAIAGTSAKIVDTRKTTPGWRLLEKYAVKCGGGLNHRFNLEDMAMFKDNHFALSNCSPNELIQKVRKNFPKAEIALEADTLDQVNLFLSLDIDILMLDNMSAGLMKKIVKFNDRKVRLEATGGINLNTIKEIADTGVDRISIGALTHSAPSVDIAMDVI